MAKTEQIKGGIMMVIGFMIVVYLGAYMLPGAFQAWFNATTSGWGDGTAALWVLVPLLTLVGVILYFVGAAFDLI